jgi:flagellar hook-basal body complex protein FliE
MSIQPIGPVAALPALPGLSAVTAPAPGAQDFSSMLLGGIDQLQGLHAKSDALAVQAATGDLQDIHDYMIASTQTSVATEMTVAVRNKAVEAFTEIMRMQV